MPQEARKDMEGESFFLRLGLQFTQILSDDDDMSAAATTTEQSGMATKAAK